MNRAGPDEPHPPIASNCESDEIVTMLKICQYKKDTCLLFHCFKLNNPAYQEHE
jgi:hypothetical protein